MLVSLSIRNIALIESLDLDFSSGFNVLTGESGAGKSILIGSISFLLGSKVSTDIIRAGAEEASVAGIFLVSPYNSRAREWLKVHNVELEGDEVLIKRTLKQNARSSIWISGQAFSKVELQELTSFLIDIHGQNEHQSLFKISEHRRFLDGFAGIEKEVKHFSHLYAELALLREEWNALLQGEKDREKERDFLAFAIEEIEKANLKIGEEEDLKAEEKKLSKFEKLIDELKEILNLLEEDGAAISLFRKACKLLGDASNIDSSLKEYEPRMEGVFYEAEDIKESLSSYYSSLDFSPERLEELQMRLALISHLEKKYGSSITDVLLYCENAKKELQHLSNSDEKIKQLEKKMANLEYEMLELGRQISKKRKENKEVLQSKVEEILKVIGMPNVRFCISLFTREEEEGRLKAGLYGFDEVEFLISANAGEGVKPLAKIASGGEISRIMLALKTVLSSNDEVETLIFDEVDVGIGGQAALNVASHIKALSQKKQILLITHLAIIASCADKQTKIEKYTKDGSTFTLAHLVVGDERIAEIARMLSGQEADDASRNHARELLKRYSNERFGELF